MVWYCILFPLQINRDSAGISWSPSCCRHGSASCQNFIGSASGTAIGVGPALRIAPVAGIPFYVAGFEAGWRVVETGVRVAGNSIAGGVETDASEFTRRPRPTKSRKCRTCWAQWRGVCLPEMRQVGHRKATLTVAGGSCALRLGPIACIATS